METHKTSKSEPFANRHKMSFSYNFGKQKQTTGDGNAPGQDARVLVGGWLSVESGDVKEPTEWEEEPTEEYQTVGVAESFSESGLS